MLNFPMPYQHELIYSTVARAGTRLALDSPKQLLDEVFKNRKVIATVDLPCRLNEPYRVCRRVNILRDYPDDKIKIHP